MWPGWWLVPQNQPPSGKGTHVSPAGQARPQRRSLFLTSHSQLIMPGGFSENTVTQKQGLHEFPPSGKFHLTHSPSSHPPPTPFHTASVVSEPSTRWAVQNRPVLYTCSAGGTKGVQGTFSIVPFARSLGILKGYKMLDDQKCNLK